jgi:chorismate dehydratase
MTKIRVSAVKYTNSIPFIYGLQNDSLRNDIILSLDTPTECYNNLFSGFAEVGLVPVIIKNHVSKFFQVSPYGIGATGDVLSVILISRSPLSNVKTITLDYQSRTSAMLVRLLCSEFWKIKPEFRQARPGFEMDPFLPGEARLIIGDRSFQFHNHDDLVVTDLAGEWLKFTGLPFVFALWASTKKLPAEFEQKFTAALNYGMSFKPKLINELQGQERYKSINLHNYLNYNIIHEISPAMQEGMNLFLHLIRNFL